MGNYSDPTTPTVIPPFQGQKTNTIKNWSQQPELYAHQLNVAQGVFYNDMQITHEAQIYPSDAGTLNSGMVCSIDPDDNLFHQGLAPGRIPFLAMPTGSYNGYAPTGNVYTTGITAIPTLQGMRVQSTEFLNNGQPYLVNQPLTAYAPSSASKGLIKHGVNYQDTIIGYVIEGITNFVATSPLGAPYTGQSLAAPVAGQAYDPLMKQVVSFLTWFLPPFDSGSTEGYLGTQGVPLSYDETQRRPTY